MANSTFLVSRRGKHLSYQRGKRNTNPGTSLIKIENVDDSKAASFYLGKRIAYVYRGKTEIRGTKIRVIWGKVTRTHGMCTHPGEDHEKETTVLTFSSSQATREWYGRSSGTTYHPSLSAQWCGSCSTRARYECAGVEGTEIVKWSGQLGPDGSPGGKRVGEQALGACCFAQHGVPSSGPSKRKAWTGGLMTEGNGPHPPVFRRESA